MLEVVLALELELLLEVVPEVEVLLLVRVTVVALVAELLGRVPVPTYGNCGL